MPPQKRQLSPTELAAIEAAYAPLAALDAVPPETPPNLAQRALKFIGSRIRELPNGVLPLPLPPTADRLAKDQVAALFDETLAHPIQHAPELAAMALTGGASGVAGKVGLTGARAALARLAASGIGGYGGARLRGDTPDEAALQGAMQLGMQGVGEVGAAVPAWARSGAWRATKTALRPTPEVIDAVVNPATGRSFGKDSLPIEAEEQFGTRALELAKGTPGRRTYARNLIADNKKDLAAKKTLLHHDPQIVVATEDLTPPQLFNPLAEALAAERGGAEAHAALGELDTAIRDILTKASPSPPPGAMRAGTNVPILSRPQTPAQWTLPELDAVVKGIDKKLAGGDAYTQIAKALRKGEGNPDTPLEMGLKQWRSYLSDLMEQRAPVLSNVPTLAELNARIHERIPYKTAAREATRTASDALPSPRIAFHGGPLPQASFFDYPKRQFAQATARPLANVGRLPEFDPNDISGFLRLLMASRER